MKVSIIAWITVFVAIVKAQAPDTVWTRTYGGSFSDYGRSVQQCTDGGYVIGGWTRSFGAGGEDFYIIKTDARGETLWTRTYGGDLYDYGRSIQQTSDGGYIITGETGSFVTSGYCDVYLIKTDASGDSLWTRTYGGLLWDIGTSIQQTRDGGYIIAGYTKTSFTIGGTDVYLLRINANGDTVWTRIYGGDDIDLGHCVRQTYDEGYIVAGSTASFGSGGYDIYLLRTDTNGDTLWARTFGGSGDDFAYSVQQTPESDFIVAGWSKSFGAGSEDAYLIRVNREGELQWTKTYGGQENDRGYCIQPTSDGYYLVSGETSSFGLGGPDVYLLKIDAEGDTLWTATYGGDGLDYGFCVDMTSDNGYIVAGYTTSFGVGYDDVYLIRLAPDVSTWESSTMITTRTMGSTIIRRALRLPKDKKCRVFDVTGKVMEPSRITSGIYFLEIDGEITQKIIKIR